MDNKTVFVRTSKGEDEAHSRTMHLAGDAKRTLMMVDGESSYGEISKRAAPSLRAGLEAMLQELEKGGYIVDKSKAGSIPRISVPPKMSMSPKMAVPIKMAKPRIEQPDESGGDLDFVSGFTATPSKETDAGSGSEEAGPEESKAEAEAKALQESEAAKLRAQQEAEAILRQAELEAARIREEAEREKQRVAFEEHAREDAARRAKEEALAARAKEEQAKKARLEAEAKEQQQKEAARKKAEQESAAREAFEIRARQEAEAKAKAGKPSQTHKPDNFAFDAFHVDESKPLDNKSVQQAFPRASGKTDEFAFGEFNIDESQTTAKPHVEAQAVQRSASSETAHTAKRDEVSFDAFKIELPEAAADPLKEEKPGTVHHDDSAPQALRPAESHHPDQHERPVAATNKPAGEEPSKEEILHAEKERKEVERRLEAEELAAKKHAEEQAKAAAEKEKRLAEAARKEIEKVAQHAKFSVDVTQPSAKHAPVMRSRRKPFSLGRLLGFFIKVGVFLLVLLIGALFAVPPLLPTRDYVPDVEKFLSEKLKQPVHVGYLSGRVLPTPRLELGEIYIGKMKQFQANQAQVYFSTVGLFIDEKPIDSIEMEGVKVSGEGLQIVTAWIQRLAADKLYPVAHLAISKGVLDADAVRFNGIEGALEFDKAGEFTQASLRSDGGKYSLEMRPATGNKQQVSITLRNGALPLLPSWTFDELTAKGVLSSDNLSISTFEGRMLGGTLQGNALVDWHSGWTAKGTVESKAITMQNLNHLLEGNLDGSARFRMSAVNLAGLADSAEMEGNFASKNGTISGMDIIETARARSREHLPGGRVHFDDLGGAFAFNNNRLRLKQVKIASNVLNAAATVDIDKPKISGSLTATLKMQETMRPVDLQIGGEIDSPTLRYVP